jgi:hypothetical protein
MHRSEPPSKGQPRTLCVRVRSAGERKVEAVNCRTYRSAILEQSGAGTGAGLGSFLVVFHRTLAYFMPSV